jgi:superfamily II DNA or RNA helicase
MCSCWQQQWGLRACLHYYIQTRVVHPQTCVFTCPLALTFPLANLLLLPRLLLWGQYHQVVRSCTLVNRLSRAASEDPGRVYFKKQMSFDTLTLSRHYNSDEVDVLEEFYRPVLKRALRYDRAVGYFSSSTFRECASELGSFVANGGKIRLLIGVMVSAADIEALKNGNRPTEAAERARLRTEVQRYLLELEGVDFNAAQTFSKLIASGVAELKFAIRAQGIYHEKLGIFVDRQGLKIAFIGSVNETAAAFTAGQNHESFAVFQSLEPAIYAAYGHDLEERFEDLWSGRTKATRIYDLDNESLALIKELATKSGPETLESGPRLEQLPDRYQLREYQLEAIKAWKTQGYKGILAMATGTGKTLTAIDAVKRVREKIPGASVVITVPYQNLAVQWMDALRDQGIEVIGVFDTHTSWYEQVKNLFMAAQYSEAVAMPCLVCVNASFKEERFQELLGQLESTRQRNNLLVVDECHHFNAPEHLKKLPDFFSLRLGLSATPYDQFDEHHLERYFGPIAYEFPLSRAIREGFLTRYRYHLLLCELDDEETALYEELTLKIVKIAGSDERMSPETLAKVQPLLLQRARVVGAAKDKLVKLRLHLESIGRTPYTLFYCGDGKVEEDGEQLRQIERVSELLHDLHWRSSRITASESLKTRELLLEHLRTKSIDAVVSIKVLDEGIDVPACQSAYLLASQSSDRQGIQRRGRVLRRSPGKDIADLYDFLVIGGASAAKSLRSLAGKEIRRAEQFAGDAENRSELEHQLRELKHQLGLN